MPCSEVPEAEEMFNELFPGLFGDDVTAKTKSEVEHLAQKETPTCISGIEFHLKRCEYRRTRRGLQALARGDDCDVCTGCIIIIIKKDKKDKE